MTTRHKRSSRRHFLKRSANSAFAASLAPYIFSVETSWAGSSPNERLGIGCIGMGGMGRADARAHARFADIIAVCDVDEKHAEQARNDPHIGKGKAVAFQDYRQVLERKDIDVVSIDTPDHWHTKIAIEALMAGKHVFCQKPLTLTLEENQLIRQACQKYNKLVFFIGTQQRSDRARFLRAVNLVQKGLLGEIKKITVGINGGPKGGPFPKTDPPPELDWNRWLGQAPLVPYIKERCHGSFRWWYEYSGGKFTDWGAHHVDIAQWAIGEDRLGTGPIEIDGTDAHHPVPFRDGYPTVDDCFNTATDYAVKCRFASGIEMIVTSRGDNGILFEGTRGRLFVNRRNQLQTASPRRRRVSRTGRLLRRAGFRSFEGHKNNFYRCIREGGLPVSDVYSHVQTMNTCHLCAIAARLKRVIRWDPKAERIVGDDQAASFFAREQRKGFEIPRV
ncbi:MAG: Gfo/Idh/MocA family oxidoreductase [Planctomycetes bacterium]|nr:Gfo/Idh/MocA family oxidoreductase [Planctomycetota bacterium]